MHPELREGEFVYVLWPHGRPLAGAVAAAVREAEGLTVVLPRAEADSLGLSYDFVGSMDHPPGALLARSHRPDRCRQRRPDRGQDQLQRPGRLPSRPHAGPCRRTPTGRSRCCTNWSQPAGNRSRPRSWCCAASSPRTGPPSWPSPPRPLLSPRSPGCPVEGEPEEVELLRALFECEEYLPEFSVVAELDGEIVGHVISTRGWVGELALLGLGPIGVVPRLQRHGIGSALMKETIARANAAGERGIALLGRPGVLLALRLRAVDLPRRGSRPSRPGASTSSCCRWPSGRAA